MPRTSDPTVRYLPPFSNPHETRRRRVSNIAICPPTGTYLPYSTYLFYIPTLLPYSPYPTSHLPHPPIHQSNPPHPIPSSPPIRTMLPRPATKLHLTIDDITDYERRKAQRDALQQQQAQQTQQQHQQTQEKSNANFLEEEEEESTRARAKAKSTRERIMGSRT